MNNNKDIETRNANRAFEFQNYVEISEAGRRLTRNAKKDLVGAN
jgi:hypothetical protein